MMGFSLARKSHHGTNENPITEPMRMHPSSINCGIHFHPYLKRKMRNGKMTKKQQKSQEQKDALADKALQLLGENSATHKLFTTFVQRTAGTTLKWFIKYAPVVFYRLCKQTGYYMPHNRLRSIFGRAELIHYREEALVEFSDLLTGRHLNSADHALAELKDVVRITNDELSWLKNKLKDIKHRWYRVEMVALIHQRRAQTVYEKLGKQFSATGIPNCWSDTDRKTLRGFCGMDPIKAHQLIKQERREAENAKLKSESERCRCTQSIVTN